MATTVVWECLSDDGWVQYPVGMSSAITALETGQTTTYVHGSHSCTIQKKSPTTATQRNTSTGKARQVRIVGSTGDAFEVAGDGEIWYAYPGPVNTQIANLAVGESINFFQGGHQYLITRLESEITQKNISTNRERVVRRAGGLEHEMVSAEADVRQQFAQSMGSSTIISVERIRAPELTRVYRENFAAVQTRLGRTDNIERTLFHGSAEGNIASICQEGFKVERNKNAGYGRGTYFASQASTSNGYAKLNPQGERKMIFSRVIVGDMVKGNSSLREPPCKPGTSVRYESMVNDVSAPSIFAIHEDGYCLPEFVITYR